MNGKWLWDSCRKSSTITYGMISRRLGWWLSVGLFAFVLLSFLHLRRCFSLKGRTYLEGWISSTSLLRGRGLDAYFYLGRGGGKKSTLLPHHIIILLLHVGCRKIANDTKTVLILA